MKSDWTCEPAVLDDDAALRAVLREAPVGGAIRVAFETEPSYFAAAAVEGDRHATFVVRGDGGRIKAMGSRSVWKAVYEGAPARLGYLGRLRFAPGHRPHLRTLAEGYERMRALRRPDELPFDLTSIVADNARARRLLERGLPGLPTYTPITQLVTLVLPTRAGRVPPGITRAGADALPDMASHLERHARSFRLAPHWSVDRLTGLHRGRLGNWLPLLAREGGRLSGCAALWDQSALRQCVVRGYAPGLAKLRPWTTPVLRVMGRPALPRVGESLRLAYVSHLAAESDEVVCRLVAAARSEAHARGVRRVVVAMLAGDRRLSMLCERFPARAYRSILYLVHDPATDPKPPSLDADNLAVEVATL